MVLGIRIPLYKNRYLAYSWNKRNATILGYGYLNGDKSKHNDMILANPGPRKTKNMISALPEQEDSITN